MATKERLFPSPRPVQTTSVTLSILDATVARFSATGAIWIFDAPLEETIENLIERLKSSFTSTLGTFPQWAGQLQWTPVRPNGSHQERFNRPMIVYGSESDPGVEWLVEEKRYDISSIVPATSERVWMATDFPQKDLLSKTPLALHNLSEYKDLPAMSVQISTFTCGGHALAVKMAHPLADAQAFMVFMHQWAATSKTQSGNPSKSLMDPPIFDPSLLDSHAAGDIDAEAADPKITASARSLPMHRFDWWKTSVPGYLEIFKPTTEASKPADLSSSTLSPSIPAPWHTWDLSLPVEQARIHFSKDELAQLRSNARSKGRPDISRLDSLLAHIWSLINRARNHTHSPKRPEEPVYLNLTLNARTRVSPPLPPSFIGSPIFLTYITTPSSVASNPKSLGPIASSIRETVSLYTPEKIGAILHDAAFEVSPQRLWRGFLGNRHTLVTSWLRLGVWDLDFGGGGRRLRYVQAVMPKVDGCVQVMESGVEGGIDVFLFLEREAMGRLLEDEGLRSFG